MCSAHKAVALISGGLDSMLAVRVLQEQGIEVEGINFLPVSASKGIRTRFEISIKTSRNVIMHCG